MLLGFTGSTEGNIVSDSGMCTLEVRAESPGMSSTRLEELCLKAADRASIVYQREFSCHPSPSSWRIHAAIRWAYCPYLSVCHMVQDDESN